MSPALRRTLIATVLPSALALGLATAGPALAECNPEYQVCGPGGGGGTQIYSNTLTVSKNSGTVTSTTAGISCGTDCTHADSQAVACEGFECPEPDPTAWESLTLTASGGPFGFAPSWTGCTSVASGQCTVTIDADKTVSLAWVDAQDPSVSLSSPPDNAIVGGTLNASAIASDNHGVKHVDFLVDNVLVSRDSSAPFSATIDMGPYAHGSEHVIRAVAADHSGRTQSSSSRTVTVDKQVSLTVGTVPAFTNASAVPVTIGTDPDADMFCKIVGGAAAVECDPPSWSGVTGSTPDGAYTYEVRAVDAVGNPATTTRSFVLDRTEPVITSFDGPTEGGVVGTDRVTFTFGATDENLQRMRCKVGSAAPGPCTGATSHELSGLTDGTVTFTLVVTDKAGNETTRTRTFQVQRPVSNTGGPAGGSTQTDQSMQGTAETRGVSPSQGAEPRKPLAAKLRYRKQRRGGRTRFTGLRLTGVPQGATITAACKGKGKGCPRKTPRAVKRSGTVRLAALAKLRLRKGAVLTITISAPGYAPRTLTLRP